MLAVPPHGIYKHKSTKHDLRDFLADVTCWHLLAAKEKRESSRRFAAAKHLGSEYHESRDALSVHAHRNPFGMGHAIHLI